MEDKKLCSSNSTKSVLHQLDSEHQQEGGVWSEKEPQKGHKLGTEDDVSLSTNTELKSLEEAEQWEQILWSVRPVIGGSFQISSATVQWDMPGVSLEASSRLTDSWSANGLQCEGASRVTEELEESENTSAEFFKQVDREEKPIRFDFRPLNSDLQWTGLHPETCDAAYVQEWKTQEKEELSHKLLGSSEDSEDEENHLTDLKPEEEQEEVSILLSRLEDIEEEQTSVNSGTSEEEPNPVSCPPHVEGLAEQTEGPGLTTQAGSQTRSADTESPKKNCFSEAQESFTIRDKVEMCTDQSAAGNSPSAQNVRNSPEIPEMTLSQEADAPAQTDRSQASSLHHREERPLRIIAEESEQPLQDNQSAEMKLTFPVSRPVQSVCGEDDTFPVSEQQESSDSTRKIEELLLLQDTELANSKQEAEDGNNPTMVSHGETTKPSERENAPSNRETAQQLAQRLFQLDGIQRADVVKHLDKDNDFSRAVGEEYLKFFDFTGQDLDHALRSFLKVVILIGETQERERVLQHFSCRFHQCNPDSFTSSGSVLSLTCALMLLNTDLHGQHVVKSMSSSKFVSNLDGMNEEGNFSKELLKTFYNSIKNKPLEWAVDEEELKTSMLLEEDSGEDPPLRSKFNPFQDVPHDKNAAVVKQGFLQRKLHADIDGKRTPWGKRGWKTLYGVLKGMVLYLQKDDYRGEPPTNEDVVSVHHSLAEQAADYTKKPHVFRLQTADWRVFLFQASSKLEMNSWIERINLVSALHSSPPFPAAVGSQRRFCRPILPASLSLHPVEHQLQSHSGMLESFRADLSYHQQNTPDGRKAKAKDVEEHRVRAEYLQYEVSRYEIYMQVLEAWSTLKENGDASLNVADLNQFDKAVCADSDDEDEGGLKKSHSSPSLELEKGPPTIVKVKRNISERRTYRRTIIPRWNKENKAQDH